MYQIRLSRLPDLLIFSANISPVVWLDTVEGWYLPSLLLTQAVHHMKSPLKIHEMAVVPPLAKPPSLRAVAATKPYWAPQ